MQLFMVVVFLREDKPPYTYSITSPSAEDALGKVVKDRLPATLTVDYMFEDKPSVLGFAVSDQKTIIQFNEACERVMDFQAGEAIAMAMGVEYEQHPDDPGKSGELATKAVLEAIGRLSYGQKLHALNREILTLKREVRGYHFFEEQVQGEATEILRLLGVSSVELNENLAKDEQALALLSLVVEKIKKGQLVFEGDKAGGIQNALLDEQRKSNALLGENQKSLMIAERLRLQIRDIRNDLFALAESVGADFDRDLDDPHMEACSAITAIADRLEPNRNQPPDLLKLANHKGPVGRLAAAGWLAANRPPGCGVRFFSYLPEAEGGSETDLTPEQVSQLLAYWVECWQPSGNQLELPPLQRKDGFTVNTVRWLGPDRPLVLPLPEEVALRELGRALLRDEQRSMRVGDVEAMAPSALHAELQRQLQLVCYRLNLQIEFAGCTKIKAPALPAFSEEDLPF